MKINLKSILRILAVSFSILVAGGAILFLIVSSPPKWSAIAANELNDVSGLNPTRVAKIVKPHTIEEISSLVSQWSGPISIGGARHSTGGQVAMERSLHLDMGEFDEVVSFSKERKEITVQSGITWRDIQRHIDPHNLSVTVMQTYANFTVGGSLSVNAHGRYVGNGPLINTVKSIKVVLADGTVSACSPENNSEIFYGAIGGYGGLGVIVEATLMLSENVRVERQDTLMSVAEYGRYFTNHIRDNHAIVFHNADLYPNHFTIVRAVSYVASEEKLTSDERLISPGKNYRFERFAMWFVSEVPGGKWMREHWFDPIVYKNKKVVWRNHEAGYDADELEPHSREKYTYVLQEYFVPIDRLEEFIDEMRKIMKDHDPNIINVSIRHALKDRGSMLAWARDEVFCFVIYYKQGTSDKHRQDVAEWTTALIDAAIANGGTYYLPYQIHASHEQFGEAYPSAKTFFQLKAKIDPSNKFQNKMWNKYYVP